MRWLPGFFILVLVVGCQDWDLEERNFLKLAVSGVDSTGITDLRISGSIQGVDILPLADHGLVWTDRPELPDILLHPSKSLGLISPDDSGLFHTMIDDLFPNTTYAFAVYAQSGAETLYSDTVQFTTETGSVTTDSLVLVPNTFVLRLYGTFSGSEHGIIAREHGFCWSAEDSEPDLSGARTNLGRLQSNASFSSTIDSLTRNVPLHCRAYAIFEYPLIPLTSDPKSDTVYGETIVFDGYLDIWTRAQDLLINGRREAVAFTIEGKGYVTTGEDEQLALQKDLWAYDPDLMSWTQRADFPGDARRDAVGFVIGNKAYVGTGDRGTRLAADFWEYDPAGNTWMRKADFPGGSRCDAVGFSIADRGYVGAGIRIIDLKRDFWEYDAVRDEWTTLSDMPGPGRRSAVVFILGEEAFIGTGRTNAGLKSDFWKYAPASGQWQQIANLPGSGRESAVAFSVLDRAFVGTGLGSSGQQKDLWMYDPFLDRWTKRGDFPGGARVGALGFNIGTKGYIATGFQNNPNTFQNDLWEYY